MIAIPWTPIAPTRGASADAVNGLAADLRQILQELGLAEAMRVE
jgi:hypothetical protein